MFRWEDGDQKAEVKFNYSMDENAKTLLDWFERISESERLLVEFRRAVRHDKLGVNEALVNIQSSWEHRRLAGPEQFLPLAGSGREKRCVYAYGAGTGGRVGGEHPRHQAEARMRVSRIAAAAVLTFASLAAGQAPPASSLTPQISATAETKELTDSLAEGGSSSSVDLARTLEQFLKKYPQTAQRKQIERALAHASIENKDDRRTILYGQRALLDHPR